MNINTNTLLNMLAPKLTIQTKSTIENLSKDGKVDVKSLLKDTNVKALLSNLLNDLATGTKTKENIALLLQNSKKMFDFKSLSSNTKEILKYIQAEPKLEKQTTVLKQFQLDMKNLDKKALKSSISNSGIFLESKLANSQTDMPKIQNDIKVVLLQIQDQVDKKAIELPKELKNQVEKALNQIDFYQLSSLSSDSNHTYLPFSQDDIEDADIKMNSNSKDIFSCHIGLALKKQGDVNAMLLLYKNNNLNINLNIQDENFKMLIQNKLQILRQSINKIGLNLQSLNVLDMQNDTKQTYEQKAYSNNESLSFGIDIKA